MSEEAYRAVYERAKANLEKVGKPNLLDIVHPIQPGMVAARAFYERFGLRLRLFSAVEADTAFNFLGKELMSPIMVAAMSDNSLSAHYPDAFRALSAAASQFGTQYLIGDCKDSGWKEVASIAPSSVRIVKPWKDRRPSRPRRWRPMRRRPGFRSSSRPWDRWRRRASPGTRGRQPSS
ncbi:MAG: alpha-hydroxy-acid oxidizing protein [Candidatus Tectomicrobia bacterium]|nr:alpha-hydroxy-acid oxidizing protein [Candidatus Tectomicrobia bacterium]